MHNFKKPTKPCISTTLQDFKLDRQDKPGVAAYQLDVGSIDGDMVLEVTMWDSGNFLLTKAHAMKFFGLVEEPNSADAAATRDHHNYILEQLKYD